MTEPVGLRIKQLREQKRMSQYELAKRSHLAQSYISNVESGQKSPTVRTLQKLAAALDVPVEYLLAGTSSEKAAGGEGD